MTMSLSYDFLHREGIRHLERMAGREWTDFNVHDPGITILEQLCYALTDLGYRIGHELPDLLASGGGEPYESLYPPQEILTTYPVTRADLRRLVLDVHGVKNAWIEPVAETVHHDPARQELHLEAVPQATEPVTLRGLYRVLIETSDLADVGGTQVLAEVVRRLHRNRNLGEDLVEVRILEPQRVKVDAAIEIAAVEDAEQLLLDILERIADYISPSIPFVSLDDRLAAEEAIEEVFEGPRLAHGFIEAEALGGSTRRSALTTSDLVSEIMAVPGVRAVRYITIEAGNRSDEWYLKLEPEWAPRLDIESSVIRLDRDNITVEVGDVTEAYKRRQQARAAGTGAADAANANALAPPPGRDRQVGRYLSIQHHFPALYGLAGMGLPESAPVQRQARARQLRAYLTFFDQVLADSFAQLAHLPDLFAHGGDDLRTYFTQPLADPDLGLEEILDHSSDSGSGSEDANGEGTLGDGRKSRFLNHLLARFSEQLTDYSLALGEALPEAGDLELRRVRDKQAFLQRYPRISSARGTAFDQLLPRGPGNLSGLEERLQLKLGLDQGLGEELIVVEHILLRPMPEDEQQSVALLAASPLPDPYSLQLSVVLPKAQGRLQQAGFQSFVAKTVREETPAHLIVYLQWLEEEDWIAFSAAHQEWLRRRRQYWCEKHGIAMEEHG
jgi:hypothetical protein